VAGLVALAFAGLTQVAALAAGTNWLFVFWLLLGGFMSVIYPVSVAHANDRMPAERAVAVSGRLILISGVGSTLGPLVGSSMMEAFGIRGLFDSMAVAAALFGIFALARVISVRSPSFKRRRPFLLIPTIFAHPLAHASATRSGTARKLEDIKSAE
jgi:MFS family permease